MTNQADAAENRELAQELESEGGVVAQTMDAPETAEVSLEASEQIGSSAQEAVEIEVNAAEPVVEEVERAVAPTAQDEGVSGVEAEPAQTTESEMTADEDASGQVVRMLAVGQQIDGVVRRVTDFGAFVDIGVGRDGLIHISELSTRRIAKVADLLSEGQAIQPWIKKLDRQRNRISLTLIDPGTKTIRDLKEGEVVEGTVSRILPYGAFIDIGIGRDALLHVREMGEGFVAKPEDVVQVGEKIEARIIELSRRRGRVDLSLKGLREEPEPVAAPEQAAQPVAETEEEPADQFEDVEVLSPMELAFKKAMEAEGIQLDVPGKRQGKRGRREHGRSIQDEIIARTLDAGRK